MFGRSVRTTQPQNGFQVTEYAKRRFKWIFIAEGLKYRLLWTRGGSDFTYTHVNREERIAPLGRRVRVNDSVADAGNAAATRAELPLSQLPANLTCVLHAARIGNIPSYQIAFAFSTNLNYSSKYCAMHLGNGYGDPRDRPSTEAAGGTVNVASSLYDATTGRKLEVGYASVASGQDVFFGASFSDVGGNSFHLHGFGRFAFPHEIQLAAFSDFTLAGDELDRVTKDPYGMLFAAPSRSLWTPAAVSVSLPTLVQPNATTSAGAWTATGAATLHAAINELVPSDTQYISVNSASTTELVLAESAYPGAANQTLAYRASSTQGSTLTVTLKQGVTTIMTRTHSLTGVDTLYTQTLSAPEIATIVAGAISVTLTTS